MSEKTNDIGYCERCGIVDHHRINGLCASCTAKAITIVYQKEPSLGYEAADVTVIEGYSEKGGAR